MSMIRGKVRVRRLPPAPIYAGSKTDLRFTRDGGVVDANGKIVRTQPMRTRATPTPKGTP